MVHRVQPDVGMGRSAAPCPMSLTAFPSYDLHSINFTCLKCVNFGSVNFGKYAQSCIHVHSQGLERFQHPSFPRTPLQINTANTDQC